MKNKVWITSPLFYIFPILMAIIGIIAWPDILLSSIGIAGAAVSLVFLIIISVSNNIRISAISKAASQFISGDNYPAFQNFSIPIAIVGDKNDIIWFNDAFFKNVTQRKDCTGDSILKFIYPKTINQTINENGVSTTYLGRKYTVYGCKLTNGYALYFIDDTYYKKILKEYNEKRTSVAIISFDNRDELTSSGSNMNDARIVSELEALLYDWSKEMGGFIRRLSNDRYLLMTDEIHIINAKEQKFQILDKVREIKNAEGSFATISIGIGRNASSMEESERWARQALDMALGRGGDQVAIKEKGDSYEFFGGLSKGVEKRDKVRTRVIAATLSDLISNCDNVLIMGHKYSDLDSMGAAIGMWTGITKSLLKPAYIVVNKSQSLAKNMIEIMQSSYPDRDIFVSSDEALSLVSKKSVVIVVDTQSPNIVECEELLNKNHQIVVIDHHRMMVNHIENAIIFYHEPYSSSASELVSELIQYISSSSITKTEANLLLAGIILDTKGFIIKTGVRTFEAAAYLRTRGADTVEVKKMFSDTFDMYLAKSKIILEAEIKDGFAISCAETTKEIRIVAAQAADELLNIQEVKASFVIFRDNDEVNISARSFGDVNVQVIMEKLGGGGHHSMAGVQIKGISVEEAKQKLISVIKECV